MTLMGLRKKLRQRSSKKRAKILQRFFKTGPGEYAEGDLFLGIKVPEIRNIVKQHKSLKFDDILQLLRSPFHEERLAALLILVLQFQKENEAGKKKIYSLYLTNTKYINNWDLIDLTAEHIVGSFLVNKDKRPLLKLAGSKILWERRIAILSTFHYIKRHKFDYTLKIAEILLLDPEDLIHKAVGWMLREAGKRDLKIEDIFLRKYYRKMPRTMLRYAIEKFPESKRQAYLKGKV